MGCSKSHSKREVFSNIILPQETRKTLNRQPNFTSKITGERRITTKTLNRLPNFTPKTTGKKRTKIPKIT